MVFVIYELPVSESFLTETEAPSHVADENLAVATFIVKFVICSVVVTVTVLMLPVVDAMIFAFFTFDIYFDRVSKVAYDVPVAFDELRIFPRLSRRSVFIITP